MRPKDAEQGRDWGHRSHESWRNERLAAALEYGREVVKSTLVFEMRTFNPRTKQRHLLELKHELRNGNDRYNLYIDGKLESRQWSRWGFVVWMFNKIESVRADFGRWL